MKKKLKKIKYILVVFLVVLMLPINVLAKDKVTLSLDKEDLKEGDLVTVSAFLDTDKKLYALTASLNYDKNVFEEIDESDFIALNENISTSYNADNNKFGLINKTGAINGLVFQVYLRVKNAPNVGNTNIVLTNIRTSDGKTSETYEKASASALITRDAISGDVLPNNQEFDANDTEEITTKTFSTMPLILGISLGLILIGAYVIYLYLNHDLKNKKKMMVGFGTGAIILVLSLTYSFSLNSSKQDINKDGVKDYQDTEEIIDYLLDIEGTKEETNEDKKTNVFTLDFNNDGKIDINDAGGSASNVTEKVHYQVKLEEKDDSYYLQKGKVNLEFYATITPNETIKEVMIDGVYYKALKVGDYYTVSLDYNKAGVHEFKITKVKLNNTRELKVKYTIKKEILKEVPYVNDFNVSEEDNSLTFRLVDVDNAFLSGVVNIYDGDTLITTAKVEEKTEVKADFKKDKVYNILILGNYDLDQDLNNNKNTYQEEEMFAHTFMISGNYNFKLSDVSITDAVSKNEKPKLSFTSTNTKGIEVERVKLTIDKVTKEYSITRKDGNNYEIELDNNTLGSHTVEINSISLKTLKTFENKKDFKTFEMTYEVLKDAPKVSKIKLAEGSREFPEVEDENNRIKKGVEVNFTLEDVDNSISKTTVVLTDSTNKIVAKKELSREDYKEYINKGEPIFLQYADKNSSNNNYGYYKVAILADYTLGDKYNFTDKNIGEETIIPNSGVVIDSIKFVKLERDWRGSIYTKEKGSEGKYATKGEEEYALEFTVLTTGINSYSRLSSITLNGLNYTLNGGATAIPDEDDSENTRKKFKYVSYTAIKVPNEEGVVSVVANRVQFEVNGYYAKQNDYYTVPEKEIKFEVLKDAPTIKNLKIVKEDRDNKEVTFAFSVSASPNSFLGGSVTLGDETKEITNENLDNKEVTFKNIELDTNYDLIFKASYDLESGLLETGSNKHPNRKENMPIYQVKYGMFEDNKYENVKIENGVAISQRGNNYFEKTEKINLEFNIVGLEDLEPSKVIIKDLEYDLKKVNDKYKIELDGFTSFGDKNIVITNIILNNGKNVKLTDSYTIKAVVLKDFPVIENYKYEIKEDEVIINFDKIDYDASLDGKLNVLIENENGETLYKGSQTNISLKRDKDTLRYYLKVIGSYDRDTDNKVDSPNYHKDVTLLEEIISLDSNNIELKNISYIGLYKTISKKTSEVSEISKEELDKNKDDYFVLVNMENLPSIYAKIKKVLEEDNQLVLVLDYEHVIKEGAIKSNEVRIPFGVIKNGVARNETNPVVEFKNLAEKIKDNQDITLTHDYDLSEIDVSSPYYFETYQGKLDGNGHKIYNVGKQLFSKLENASITNLVISDANVSGNVRGILASTATDTEIKNVHIYNGIINANNSEVGTGIMLGDTRERIEIINSSIVNSSVSGGKRTGGFIGQAFNKTTLKDSYINESNVSGSWDAIGGVIGEISNPNNVTISNCYSKVTMNTSNGTAKAGILGYTNNTRATKISDSLSLADGTNGKRVHGNGITASNIYELKESNMASNKDNNIKEISKDEINSDFFKNQLHWDLSIWNLEDVSYNKLPSLKGEVLTEESYMEKEVGYDKTKVNLYNNLMKLMPFYSNEKIISTANKVVDKNLINNEIVNIVPIDKNGKLVTYLTSDDYKKIKKIKIIYKDRQKATYDVSYDNTYDMIASYRIKDLKIDYNYKHYIINADSQIVMNLTNYLKKLNYTDNLDILTSTADSRIYKDFYNETTSKELKEFVLKFLSNSNFTNTSSDGAINNYLEKEVKKDKKIEKVLYMYNYFKRFYSLDIDGIALNDFMLFNLDGFNETLTPLKIAELYLKDGNNFSTGNTNKKYVSVLSNYTKLSNISKLLEYLVLGLSNHTMDEWTRSQFKGYLVEIPIKGHSEVQYTLWDHFSNPDKGKDDTSYQVYDYILPILTLPKNAAYIISSPVQFIIGAERSYIKNPDNKEEQATLKRRIASYVTRMTSYFNTAYGILEDKEVFNKIHTYHLDKRFAYDENGLMVYQQQLVTEEPFHKNFNEVVGRWATSDGNAAVAWGDRIEWSAEGLLDGNLIPEDGDVYEYTYHTWSHESAHNIDARLFLRDNGRRFDAGGEDYADGNLTQSFGPSDIVMNLSNYYQKGTKIAANYTPERINTKEKIFDYYNKVFKTIYVMDYIEAQAFLQLSPEDQADVAVQVSYPNENAYDNLDEPSLAEYRNYQTTAFNQRDTETFENMNLKTIDDLYDNKLMIYPGVYKLATRGSNSYGGEGIGHVHWYQPNNPYGRPDSYSLKWFAYEMLGYKGYDAGYIEYYSNINSVKKKIYTNFEKKTIEEVNYKSDAMALKTITGYDDFRTYKLARFDDVEKNLKYLNSAINVSEYVQKFYDALIEDGEASKKRLSELFKNGEQKCLNDYWCRIDVQSARSFAKSTALRQEIYFTLKDLTNDFQGDIYSKTVQQEIGDLKVSKDN